MENIREFEELRADLNASLSEMELFNRRLDLVENEVNSMKKDTLNFRIDLEKTKSQLDMITHKLDDVGKDVKELLSKPLRKFEKLEDRIVFVIVGMLVGYLMLQLFPMLR